MVAGLIHTCLASAQLFNWCRWCYNVNLQSVKCDEGDRMFATAIKESGKESGLRLLDPSKDLMQVADLIEESFAGEFTPAGLAAVRDLRMMSSMGPFLWLLTRTSSEFRDALTGFVWIDAGKIVGNVTLTRAKPTSNRWHMSNVAVTKTHRGQGIGRRLIEAGLEFAKARHGEWTVLQVRDDNEPALRIYDTLEFERLYATTELYLDGPFSGDAHSEIAEGYDLHPCRPEDWRKAYDLAIATTPAMARWVQGVELAEFRRSAFQRFREWMNALLTGGRISQLCAEQDEDLAGAILVHSREWGGDTQLRLRVHPEHRGAIEQMLVSHALAPLRIRSGRRATTEHSTEHSEGIAALKHYGFQEKRTLVTMRRRL